MKPLISVIIPAHNNEKSIETAIRSILIQTWDTIEIIVVDDNSTDNTRLVVEKMQKEDARISYYSLPFNDPMRINKRGRNINAGYSARNYGFEKVTGEYITFQDADDASFKNRLEIQFKLLKEYNATHVTLDWQRYNDAYIGKSFDVEAFVKHGIEQKDPQEIQQITGRAKGIAIKLLGPLHSKIDFELKRLRFINKLFFGTLEAYPGTGNSPLFKREVIEKVRFRKLSERVWPSFMGRGADRDFNFQVAETFGNSYVFFIPLYMWRQSKDNEKYPVDLKKYIID